MHEGVIDLRSAAAEQDVYGPANKHAQRSSTKS